MTQIFSGTAATGDAYIMAGQDPEVNLQVQNLGGITTEIEGRAAEGADWISLGNHSAATSVILTVKRMPQMRVRAHTGGGSTQVWLPGARRFD